MSSYPGFGFGTQRLIDTQLTWARSGLPVYLRVRNFPDIQMQKWSQLGFSIAPTGTSEVGTTDILIAPPPAVSPVSVHNIGQSKGKLRFGARIFLISNTFVKKQAAAMGLSDSAALFRQPSIVGLFTDGVLNSIEDVINEQVAGLTVSWILTCNAREDK